MQKELNTTGVVPAINQPWPEQGGIYVGTRLIGGQMHHVIIPGGIEFNIEGVEYTAINEALTFFASTNGYTDWRAPDTEDLLLAYNNAREHFVQPGRSNAYWSRTLHPLHLGLPLVFVFDHGYATSCIPECRLSFRPFRSFPV